MQVTNDTAPCACCGLTGCASNLCRAEILAEENQELKERIATAINARTLEVARAVLLKAKPIG